VNLQRHGIRAAAYHAGIPGRSREKVQDDFLRDRVKVIVATIAFGMGVDKPNVRFVIHHDLPKSIESYYQETGRAGRDGMESEALMLYGSGDVNLVRRLIENVENIDQRRVEVHKLNSMVAFSEALTCRRRVLLGYFGEALEEPCGNCDICLDPPATYDATELAQVALQCVSELNGHYGMGYIVDVLRGSNNARIREQKHDHLKSHGAGADINADEWTSILRQLVHHGYFIQDVSKRAAMLATKKSEHLGTGEPVLLAKYQPGIKRQFKRLGMPRDEALFKKLVQLREEIADRENLPPHVVFSDVTLTELSQRKPTDGESIRKISGVGQHKLEAYGEAFIKVIKAYEKTTAGKKLQSGGKDIPMLIAKGPGASETQIYTLSQYRKDMPVEKIATAQGVSKETILKHFISLIRAGHYIDVPAYIGKDFDMLMAELDEADPYASLSEIKRDLSIELNNEEFRLVLAWREGIGVA
jgi:ATP-dependent DNA helicase RecQ